MRALMVAVVTMGVLIVAGTVTLATLVLSRGPSGLPKRVNVLDEPDGTRIVDVRTADHDRLILLLHGGGKPDRAVLYDLRREQEVSRLSLAR